MDGFSGRFNQCDRSTSGEESKSRWGNSRKLCWSILMKSLRVVDIVWNRSFMWIELRFLRKAILYNETKTSFFKTFKDKVKLLLERNVTLLKLSLSFIALRSHIHWSRLESTHCPFTIVQIKHGWCKLYLRIVSSTASYTQLSIIVRDRTFPLKLSFCWKMSKAHHLHDRSPDVKFVYVP